MTASDTSTLYGFVWRTRSRADRMTHIMRQNETEGGKSLCGVNCYDVSPEKLGPMCGRCVRKSASPPPPAPKDLDAIRVDLIGLRALVTHLNAQVADARSRADMAVADLAKVKRELARVLKDQAARDRAPADTRAPKPDVIHAATPEGDRFLTRTEAAEVARLHPGSLDRLCAQGLGPKRIKIGKPGGKGRVLFDREEVEQWLARQEKG